MAHFKTKALLLILVISVNLATSFASENPRNERKVLIQFVKSDYYSWLETPQQNSNNEQYREFDKQSNIERETDARNQSYPKSDHKPIHKKHNEHHADVEFRDFDITIVEKQAIVQFTVGSQRISAFLEKENGKWKLVTAANISEAPV